MFASRWGIIFAGLGMAVGTGNIWRFPRIVSQYGGGAFIILWLLFLFLWSIPLLTIEISMGKKTRLGVIGSFGNIMGKQYAWMGSFVAFVTTAIMFYYSVVTGWCLKYFFASTFQGLVKRDASRFWESFTSSGWEPMLFHLSAMGIGAFIIYKGVVKGIERANKILIPALFFLLVIACIRSLTLPNAFHGLNFLFSPNLSMLADYKTWINALSQSAWSTGAGWGLMLTYAVYSHKKERPLLTSTTLGFGNNLASLLAAVAVIPTVFSFYSISSKGFSSEKLSEVMKVMEADNQGLTFKWIPTLFSKIPGGEIFLPLFFLALSFAAFSSLISMLELDTRILMDAGLTRKKSIAMVAACGFIFGLPSALSMKFFNNQDYAWGLGLLVSGLFFTLAVIKFGTKKFRREFLQSSEQSGFKGKFFEVLVKFLLPLQFLVMISWWFLRSSLSTLGIVLLQWFLALGIFIVFNKTITKKLRIGNNES